MNNALPLRTNVCLLIVNRDRHLFLGERAGAPGHWQLPQGGVEPELSVTENVLKEAAEETGADPAAFRIVKQLAVSYEYDYDKTPHYAVGRWRGQSQTFWWLEFLGEDADIDLQRSQQEFMAWKWCSLPQVLELADSRRLLGYRPALAELTRLWGSDRASF